MIKYLILLLMIVSIFCSAQTTLDVQNLKERHQKCLDKGAAMHICSYEFYNSSDKLLNKSYFKLYKQLGKYEQIKLKKEQRIWLKKRDAIFKRNFEETKNLPGFSENTQDFKMILNQKNATFVLARTQFLIDKR